MKSRFSTVAGILAAATLLSGSVFAIAPEFSDDLPTVIITDRLSDGAAIPPAAPDFDAPSGDWSSLPGYDGFRPSSAFLFRYDDAVDLTPIITLNDAASISDVKVVFNEFDNVDDSVPNSTLTLNINGASALTDFPVKADYSGGNSFTAGLLSFRNVDFSPGTGTGPFDPVGDVTSQDLRLTPSQSRIVTLYIDTVDSTTGGGDATSLEVITQIDDIGDRTSEPGVSDPFQEPVYDTLTNFDGWEIALADNRILGINSNGPSSVASAFDQSSPNLAGFVLDPAVTPVAIGTPVPAGRTAPLSESGTAAQVGLMGWGLKNDPATVGDGISLEAKKIYRLRVNMQSANAATNGSIFIRLGDVFNTGSVNAGYSDPALFSGSTRDFPALGTAAEDFDVYLEAFADYETNFSISLIDDNASDGNEVQINSATVAAAASRAALGTGTVLKNYGAATFTAAAGQPAVVDTGRADFVPSTSPIVGTPGESIAPAAGLNAAVPETLTPTASVLTAQTGPAPAGDSYWEFCGFSFVTANPVNIDTLDTGLNLIPGRLYVTDVWASTTTPGRVMPEMLVRINSDLSFFSATGYHVGEDGLTPGFENADMLLASGAKLYSNVFSPASPNAEARSQIQVSFIWTLDAPFGTLQSSTIRIHRIILTEYEVY